jgi:hypothetical protein
MELLGGLALSGKYLRDKDKDTYKKKIKKVSRNKPNSRNIYTSNRTRETFQTQLNTAKKRYDESLYPEKTGVIPNSHNKLKYWNNLNQERKATGKYVEPFGDHDSVFSDDTMNSGYGSLDERSIKSLDLADHTALYKAGEALSDNKLNHQKFMKRIGNNRLRAREQDNRIQENTVPGSNTKSAPGFLSQFEELSFNNPGSFVSSNSTPKNTNNTSRLEMDRDLALKGGYTNYSDIDNMTYNVVKDEDFQHNNMVPYFRKTAGYGDDKLMQQNQDYLKQRKVELFSGNLNNLDYRPKTERRPLFNPLVGLTNIYGMPNFTEYMATRYVPSRERRNEFPVQPVKVTPGLNIGYNEVSKQGFHDMYRAMPRTTNQLRAANNPKVTYNNVINHGKKGEKRSTMPNVAKRKPVTFWENDPRDWVKSLGYVRAPKIRGNWDAPSTNRQRTAKRTWQGPLGDQQHGKTPAFDMVTNIPDPTMRDMTQHKTYQAPLGNNQHQKGHAFDMVTNIPDVNMRNIHENKTYQGPLSNQQHQKGPAFDMVTNIPDPTMRNLHENKTYQGPISNSQHQKGHAFDMITNIPDPTMRNIHEKKTHQNPLGTLEQHKGGYTVEHFGKIAPPTLRQMTQNKTHQNPLGTLEQHKGGYTVEQAGKIAPPTLRQMTQNKTHQNPLGTLEQHKGGYTVQQAGTRAPPTMRQMTQNKTHQNPLGTHQHHKGGYTAEQAGTRAPPTMRQMTQNKTHQNPLGTLQHSKGGYTAEQAGTRAPPTLRQMTQNKTHQNPLGTLQHSKGGYIPQHGGTFAPPTLRQMTQNKTHQNPLGSLEHHKQRNRRDAANSYVNTTKEIIAQGRYPTTSNYEKGPTYEHTMVNLCEPIQVNRELYGHKYGANVNQCIPTMHTRMGYSLPQTGWRSYTKYTGDNLSQNPYINNTQHKSTEYNQPPPKSS